MGRKRRSSTTRPDAIFHTPTPLSLAPLIRPIASPSTFTEIEDRRTFHPLDAFRPPMEIGGTSAPQPIIKKRPFKRPLPFGLQFAAPKRTLICVRRKQRKEVLHAKRKTGKGAGRRRNPRRNPYSNIGC